VKKAEFLCWLEQYRHVGNIKAVVEQRTWSEAELDRLKETLENTGRLEMKNDYGRRRRMAWG